MPDIFDTVAEKKRCDVFDVAAERGEHLARQAARRPQVLQERSAEIERAAERLRRVHYPIPEAAPKWKPARIGPPTRAEKQRLRRGAIAARGKVGMIEKAERIDWMEKVPVIGQMYKAIKIGRLQQDLATIQIAERERGERRVEIGQIEAARTPGGYLPEQAQDALAFAQARIAEQDEWLKRSPEMQRVTHWFEQQEEQELRGETTMAKILEGVSELPSYMVDFLLTSGVARLGSHAAKRAAIRILGHYARKRGIALATKGIGWAVGGAFRTAFMPHRTWAAYQGRRIPQFEFTDDGRVVVLEAQEKPFTSAFKALGDILIENLSETAGARLGKIAGRSLRRVPGAKRLAGAFRRAVGKEGLGRLRKVGYDGFLQEMGEERLGDLMRAITGVQDFGETPDSTMFERIIGSVPNGEEMLVEAGVLAVPGVAGAVISQRARAAQKRMAIAQAQADELLKEIEGPPELPGMKAGIAPTAEWGPVEGEPEAKAVYGLAPAIPEAPPAVAEPEAVAEPAEVAPVEKPAPVAEPEVVEKPPTPTEAAPAKKPAPIAVKPRDMKFHVAKRQLPLHGVPGAITREVSGWRLAELFIHRTRRGGWVVLDEMNSIVRAADSLKDARAQAKKFLLGRMRHEAEVAAKPSVSEIAPPVIPEKPAKVQQAPKPIGAEKARETRRHLTAEDFINLGYTKPTARSREAIDQYVAAAEGHPGPGGLIPWSIQLTPEGMRLAGRTNPFITKATDLHAVAKAITSAKLAEAAPPPAEAKPAGKEPWEMTFEEWSAADMPGRPGRPRGAVGPENLRIIHSQGVVRQAVETGKPVPAEVLRDYAGEKWADEALAKLEAKPRKRLISEEAYKKAQEELGKPELGGGLIPISWEKIKAMGTVILYHIESGVYKLKDILARTREAGYDDAEVRQAWREIAPMRKAMRLSQQTGRPIPAEAIVQARELLEVGAKPKLDRPSALLAYAAKGMNTTELRAARAAARDVVGMHRDLAEYARERLPKAEVERAMPAILRAQTTLQKNKAVAAIELLARRVEQRDALREWRAAEKEAKARLGAHHKTPLRPAEAERVGALLESVRTREPKAKTIQRARAILRAIETNEEAQKNIPSTIRGHAKGILDAMEATPVKKLDADAIRQLSAFVNHVIFLSDKKNQRYFGLKARGAVQDVQDSTGEIEGRFKPRKGMEPGAAEVKKEQGFIGWLATTGQLSVDSVAHDMGGLNSTIYELLVENPREGQRQFLEAQQKAQDFLRERFGAIGFTAKELKDWQRISNIVKTALPEAIQIDARRKGRKVRELSLTRAQRLDLLCHLLDPDTRSQIIRSKGIKIKSFEGRPIRLTARDLRALDESFTERERAVARVLFDYVNGPGRDLLNEGWQRTHGHDIAHRTSYWPRKRDWEFKQAEPDKILLLWAHQELDAQGIFKPRVGGKEAILVSDAFAKFQTHINRVAAFYGKHAPLMDAMRLLDNPDFRFAVNTHVPHGRDKLRGINKAMIAYRGFQIDNEGRFASGLRKVVRRAHVGVLGFKPHIALYQVVSLYTATAEMGETDILRAWNWRLPVGEDRAALMRSPVLRARLEGTGHQIFTPEFATQTSQQFYFRKTPGLTEKAMKAIKFMDELAIVNIYRASVLEGKRKNLSGQELEDFALRRAEFVMDRTQPTWDPLTVSFLSVEARTSIPARIATLFSSQRAKNLNILYRAFSDFRHSKKTFRDYISLSRKVGIVVVQSAMIYGIGNWFWGLMKPDDEEKARGFVEHAFGVSGRLLGNWIVIGDLLHGVSQGVWRGVEGRAWGAADSVLRKNILSEMVTSALQANADYSQAIMQAAKDEQYQERWRKGERKWKQSVLRGTDQAVRAVTIASGVPLELAWRVGRERVPALKTAKTNTFYYNNLWRAVASDDPKVGKRTLVLLKKRGVKWSNIRASAKRRKAPDEDYKRLSRWWEEMK